MLAEPENSRRRLLSPITGVDGGTGKVAELSTADSRSAFIVSLFIVSLEIEQI
jgi:hypothetical protein